MKTELKAPFGGARLNLALDFHFVAPGIERLTGWMDWGISLSLLHLHLLSLCLSLSLSVSVSVSLSPTAVLLL